MVLGDLKMENRPLAAGYFILDTLRTLFLSGIDPKDEVRLHVGLMTDGQLAELKRTGVDVFSPNDNLTSWMGDLYKLQVEVSRGREPAEDE